MHLSFAKIAEKANRNEEMFFHMYTIAQLGKDLTGEEKKLLSTSFKNVTTPLINSWKILEKEELNGANKDHVKQLKKKVGNQLEDICDYFLLILEQDLFPTCESVESKAFFYKIKGDCLSCKSEIVAPKNEGNNVISKCIESYSRSNEIAKELSPIHPLRLDLALSFALFYNRVLNSPNRACKIVQNALDQTLSEKDNNLSEEETKDSNYTIQLLREKIEIWNK